MSSHCYTMKIYKYWNYSKNDVLKKYSRIYIGWTIFMKLKRHSIKLTMFK
jgi:hypothetical protein